MPASRSTPRRRRRSRSRPAMTSTKGAQQAPETAYPLDVDRTEGAEPPTRRADVADDATAGDERHHDRRPQSPQRVAVRFEAYIGGHLRHADDTSVEQRTEQRVGGRKTRDALEVGRVAVGRGHNARSTMFREHRERAPVVGEIADAKPIVRDERLQRGRQIIEKRAGLKVRFERPADRGQTLQEAGLRRRAAGWRGRIHPRTLAGILSDNATRCRVCRVGHRLLRSVVRRLLDELAERLLHAPPGSTRRY